jgi:hypothetical protein
MKQEGAIGDVDDLDPVERLNGGDDPINMGHVLGERGHVPHLHAVLDTDKVDRVEQPVRLADRLRDARKRAWRVVEADAQGGAERSGGMGHRAGGGYGETTIVPIIHGWIEQKY